MLAKSHTAFAFKSSSLVQNTNKCKLFLSNAIQSTLVHQHLQRNCHTW